MPNGAEFDAFAGELFCTEDIVALLPYGANTRHFANIRVVGFIACRYL
jgi:hypothetical protein